MGYHFIGVAFTSASCYWCTRPHLRENFCAWECQAMLHPTLPTLAQKKKRGGARALPHPAPPSASRTHLIAVILDRDIPPPRVTPPRQASCVIATIHCNICKSHVGNASRDNTDTDAAILIDDRQQPLAHRIPWSARNHSAAVHVATAGACACVNLWEWQPSRTWRFRQVTLCTFDSAHFPYSTFTPETFAERPGNLVLAH